MMRTGVSDQYSTAGSSTDGWWLPLAGPVTCSQLPRRLHPERIWFFNRIGMTLVRRQWRGSCEAIDQFIAYVLPRHRLLVPAEPFVIMALLESLANRIGSDVLRQFNSPSESCRWVGVRSIPRSRGCCRSVVIRYLGAVRSPRTHLGARKYSGV